MKIIKLDAIDSTNSHLKKLLNEEALEDLTVVVSKHQTNGRGRNGAVWSNKPSLNLAFSLLKRFNSLSIKDKFYLNIISSISVYELLKKFHVKELTIKWPNDIMTENKKISGILIENNVKGAKITHSIIGVGINVNQNKFRNLPNATSIFNQTGIENSLDNLANELLKIFKNNFQFFENNFENLFTRYNDLLFRKNINTTFIIDQNKYLSGEIVEVNKKGIVKIKKSNGEYEDFIENEIKMKI